MRYLLLILAPAFLGGCSIKANLKALLSLNENTSSFSIDGAETPLIFNLANYQSKTVSGDCISEQPVSVSINSTTLATVPCSGSRWEATIDTSALPDHDNYTLIATDSISTVSVPAMKDIVPPTISGLSDSEIPELNPESTWSCTDANELCQFRSFESTSPVHVFLTESFSSASSKQHTQQGYRYLYVQAVDKAGNLSSTASVEISVGLPQLFIGGLFKVNSYTGIEDLNILAPNSLVEMALYNNANCSGPTTWSPKSSTVNSWSLDPASLGGVAHVSVKFRTSSLVESSCYTDSINWLSFTSHNICSTPSVTSDKGKIVDSGGPSGNYADNEDCATTINPGGPAIFSFSTFDVEGDYDYVEIKDNGVSVFRESGTLSPASVSTTSNNVEVRFTSDSIVNQSGFQISWIPASMADFSQMAIQLNSGNPISASATVAVTLNAPTHLNEAYVTEDSSCSTGGSWGPSSGPGTWTFSDPSSGQRDLYVKFRDAFGAESFCMTASIELQTPSISIDNLSTNDELGVTLPLRGSCSIPNAPVQVSGTVSGSTTCDTNREWQLDIDIRALPNNSTLSVTAKLMDGATQLASYSDSYLVKRSISFLSPASLALVGPNFFINGSCNINGASVSITGSDSDTTICDDGSWESEVTVSGSDGDTLNFTASLVSGGQTVASQSISYTLSTAAPTVTIIGAPTGTSTATSVSISFGGTSVAKVKYHVTDTGICSNPIDYGPEVNPGTSITMPLTGYPNGNITVCAVGKSAINGVWQAYANATTATWIKDSEVQVFISSDNTSVEEGTSNNTVTFQMTGSKSFDTQIHFSYFGKQVYMVDHNLAPGYVTIPAGSTTASITYNTFDTMAVDGDRELLLYITHTDKASVTIGALNTFHQLIRDNDKVYTTVTDLSVSRYNTCAIYSDGKLFCWGDNYVGQLGLGNNTSVYSTIEPIPGETFLSAAINDRFGCAVNTSNKLRCWGNNYFGQLGKGNKDSSGVYVAPTFIDAAEDYQKVVIGNYHGCGLTTSNKIKCWGANSSGQVGNGTTSEVLSPTLIDAATDYQIISAGEYGTCGITSSNDLKCWGANYRQIIDDSSTHVSTPTIVDAGVKYNHVAAGATLCGITDTQKLKCWGQNTTDKYKVGSNSTVNQIGTPTIIDGATNYIHVGTGCAVTTSNELKCWGEVPGTFDNDQYNITPIPTAVNDGILYSKIFTSQYGHCGITTNGLIVCMGDAYNKWSVPEADPTDFVMVDPTQGFAQFSVGVSASCGIKNNGHATCWGSSYTGGGPNVRTPVVLDNGADYTGGKTFGSENGTCIVKATGELKCTGYNYFGAVGNGASGSNTDAFFMSAVNPAIQFASADKYNYCGSGVGINGKLYMWGLGGSGDCTSASPTMVDAGTNYIPDTLRVSSFSCAITTANALKCWGYDGGQGQLGGSSRTSPTVLDSGTSYQSVELYSTRICGLTTAGTIKCWGGNIDGMVGNNSTTDTSVPFTVDGGNTFTKMSLGSRAVCGIRTGGELKCWGYWGDNATKRLTPTTVNSGTNYADIKLNAGSAIAITTSGELHYFRNGRYDLPPEVIQSGTVFTEVDAHSGGYTLCAKDNTGKLWCPKSRWDGRTPTTPRYMGFRQ